MAYQPQPSKKEDDAHVSGDLGFPLLGVRLDSDTSPVDADGDYHTLLFNNQGRLKVSTQPGSINAITGSISAIQPVISTPVANATVVADVSRASNVNMYCTGTFAGVNVTFEGSVDNGTNWFGIQAVRTNANTVETVTGALSAAPTYAWELSVNALTHVRVRATARTSGTQNWTILPGSYATEPIPAIQTHPVSQSGTWQLSANAAVTGTTVFFSTTLTNTDVAVKTSAGRVYVWDFYNPNSTDVYVQFWNALIANVTPGTTAPLFSIRIPANSGRDYESVIPISFGTAISIAATTTPAGATAPTLPLEARLEYV